MACPGGCIGGGGQPRSKDKDVLSKRQGALYGVDERATLRRSYESPVVKQVYEEWLGQPNSHTVGGGVGWGSGSGLGGWGLRVQAG